MVKLYVNESGVVLEFWTNIDLSLMVNVKAYVRKPSGSMDVWDLNVMQSNPHVATYVLNGSEFNEKGVYKIQLVAEGQDISYRSRIITLYVDNGIRVMN